MKNRKSIIAVLAVLLVAAIAIGSTLAFLTDADEVVNTFVLGSGVEIDLDEYDYEDPYEFSPGRAYAKNPTVEAVEGESFMRMIVSFYNVVENAAGAHVQGDLITDQARIDLIKQMMYYDTSFRSAKITTVPQAYAVNIPIAPVTNPPTSLLPVQQRSIANLDALRAGTFTCTVSVPAVPAPAPLNTVFDLFQTPRAAASPRVIGPAAGDTGEGWFVLDTVRSAWEDGRYVFNFTAENGDAASTPPVPANRFVEGDFATLFTTVVFPSNWGNAEMTILRGRVYDATDGWVSCDDSHGFQIVVRAEAIQTTGFASSAIAFDALDGYSPWITP